jgi:hypothetical protein
VQRPVRRDTAACLGDPLASKPDDESDAMAISEIERNHLHNRLTQVLGEEDAAVLMSHLPPSGWSDVVRTGDLDARLGSLESRIDAKLARVDTALAELRGELHRQTSVHLIGTAGVVGLVATLTQLFG